MKNSFCFIKKIGKKLCFFCSKEKPRVMHVALNGVIGKDSRFSSGLNIESVFPLLKKAFEDKEIKAVAITINSPGGSPVQSELIYKAIREFSESKKIPVYTFARDVAASGGYWLLLSGDEIYAHNSSIIGSIGVIFSGFGFVDAIKRLGVERRIYTEGKNKAILDPFMPEEQENIEILKDAQRDIFEGFKDFVKSRRKEKLKGDEKFLNEKIFTGAFWSGRKAVELGLVDEIADMRSKIQEKFGEKVEIIEVNAKKGFLKSLLSEKTSATNNAVSRTIGETLNQIEERLKFGQFGL